MSSALEVDRYVLSEPIAVGGMATVYFARQRGAAGFSKVVAIKRMRPDLVHQKEFVELFLDEARLASRVRHANVVSVIDVIASGDELLLVMEYFHGESLARLLERARAAKKPVPPAIAVAIVCDVLLGLHAAHEAKDDRGAPLGIVHRDVSPQNVIVGVDGVARVADFGIARAAGQIHATDEGKTRGKAGYSAPEQLRGGPVTRKIDVFAACVVLWEILVGRRLFEGETQAAVVAAVLTDPIDAPGLSVPSLPEALDEVILRGLDRDPKRRPETALELALALEQALPPAGAAAVSAWVRELAGEDLDRREEIVRRIESGAVVAAERPADVAASPGIDAGSGSLATSRSSSVSPARRPRALPLVVGAAAIAAVVGVVATRAARAPERPATDVRAVSDVPSAVVAASSASTVPPPSATEEPAPAPVAPSASATPPRPTSRPAPRQPPRQAGPKSKRCDPPYDLDPAGRKLFRVECL